MKVVLQRVRGASVAINGDVFSSIDSGMLILFCVEKQDSRDKLQWLVNKVLGLRIFPDENGKMNKSIVDIHGEILVVSQFTLAADCKKGTRPSFDNAGNPDIAHLLYDDFVKLLKDSGLVVKTGVFAANMQVSLINDGPVTFVLNK